MSDAFQLLGGAVEHRGEFVGLLFGQGCRQAHAHRELEVLERADDLRRTAGAQAVVQAAVVPAAAESVIVFIAVGAVYKVSEMAHGMFDLNIDI